MPNKYKEKLYFTKLKINLSDYDFSDTCVDLIASASGRFVKDKDGFITWGGFMQNSDSLKNSNTRLIVQCSSIGKSLKEKFFYDLTTGFQCSGDAPKIEIIYPTETYIDSFPLGRELSSCLFLGNDAFLLHRYKFKKFEMLPEQKNRVSFQMLDFL